MRHGTELMALAGKGRAGSLLAVFPMLLCGSLAARSEEPAQTQPLKLAKATLSVDGDSTLHKYRLEAKKIAVVVDAERPSGSAPMDLKALAVSGGIKTLDLRVPVSSLTSTENGLDDNLRKALEADQHPEIRFQMDSYEASPGADAATLLLKIKGRLQVAAVEKPVEIDATATLNGTALHVVGSKALLMSDYGIKPPTFMVGMMKVKDPITVQFDMTLEPNPEVTSILRQRR